MKEPHWHWKMRAHPPRWTYNSFTFAATARKLLFTLSKKFYYPIMSREISLSGGDISVLKALGLNGTETNGKTLLDRVGSMESSELIDTLDGLMMFDYVLCDLAALKKREDLEKASFKVNPASVKVLKEALTPQRKEREPKRQRRG